MPASDVKKPKTKKKNNIYEHKHEPNKINNLARRRRPKKKKHTFIYAIRIQAHTHPYKDENQNVCRVRLLDVVPVRRTGNVISIFLWGRGDKIKKFEKLPIFNFNNLHDKCMMYIQQ